MNYSDLKAKQTKEMEEFTKGRVFFAFSNEQFTKGMRSFGLNDDEESLKKIASIGVGGYILEDYIEDYENLLLKQGQELRDAIEDDKANNTGFMYDMFRYELRNHEFGYSGDDTDTLDALGITQDELQKDSKLRKALEKAKHRYLVG